ncbi:MAG: PAS domain S-box protein [Spirochaetaceae bacterium]|nr:PAS domain S-box protein [Spirochaetaceae bacterium]
MKQHISFTEEIALTHEQSVFSLKFSSLNFLYPEKNQYAYFMEGIDKDWIYVDSSQRFATYTNLDPGEYRFNVKGSNNDGIWNDQGVSVQIKILPPWWESWWAIFMYILIIVSIVFLIITFRTSTLKKTKEGLEQLIDSMPSILIGVESSGKITHLNQTAKEMMGILGTDVIGKNFFDVFTQMESEREMIRKSIITGETKKELKKSRMTENGIKYENLTVFPFIANGVKNAVIRIDDVTESVRMEETMIQNEKILSVGGLAAGMAHEINNPLAGIIQTTSVLANRIGQDLNLQKNREAAERAGTSIEAIKKYMDSRDIPRMLDAIKESGKRVSSIVGNMLSFARKGEGEKSSHSMMEIIHKTLKLASTDYDLKRQYDFKTIEIKKEYSENLPLIICEEAKIQQVLLNIFRNGAEAMHESQTENPGFIIRLYSEQEQHRLILEIEDNGPGISEEIRRRIFEPFFTTKPIGIGTGLGLSISYFIITVNHNGEMSVESTPGIGTKFVISLPIEPAD